MNLGLTDTLIESFPYIYSIPFGDTLGSQIEIPQERPVTQFNMSNISSY